MIQALPSALHSARQFPLTRVYEIEYLYAKIPAH